MIESAKMKITFPKVSRFNEQYFCSVDRVEVDDVYINVVFKAQGDKRFLQHPRDSVMFADNGCLPKMIISAESFELDQKDPTSSYSGTLKFSKHYFVLKDQVYRFQYGKNGYNAVDVFRTEKSERYRTNDDVTLQCSFPFIIPKMSVYNDSYRCSVLEVWWNESEVNAKFVVVGDMSLGSLQLPLRSKFVQISQKGANEVKILADHFIAEKQDFQREISGILKYSARKFVDNQSYAFSYGESGYSFVFLINYHKLSKLQEESTMVLLQALRSPGPIHNVFKRSEIAEPNIIQKILSFVTF